MTCWTVVIGDVSDCDGAMLGRVGVVVTMCDDCWPLQPVLT